MSHYGAVLLRPMTAPLSGKVAAALMLGLLSLLLLGSLAVNQLSSYFKSTTPVLIKATALKNEKGLPSTLTLYDQNSTDKPGDGGRAIEAWIAFLNAHPESRMNLTVNATSGSATEDGRRVASLIQQLSSAGVDPHRIRCIQLPQFESALDNLQGKVSSLNDRVVVEIKLE